jgi:3-isopropylmalate/(R)-2-methylmalate dehydratase small subunit
MQAFTRIDAVAVPMRTPNIDTDQIIPARFLRKPRNEGCGQFLFHDVRFDEAGKPRAGFALTEPAWQDAKILVAGRNFGCGSSREYAVYALWDFGIRCIIAPSFGDIFRNNALQNGLLPVVLPEADVRSLLDVLEASPGRRLTVDLATQTVTVPGGQSYRFEIDPYRKECLLRGVDEIGYTLALANEIAAYEKADATRSPWL